MPNLQSFINFYNSDLKVYDSRSNDIAHKLCRIEHPTCLYYCLYKLQLNMATLDSGQPPHGIAVFSCKDN